ncbi:MAG TPA: hypothetical protein VFV98_19320 [Vicinamibacterales bacterium]|nr:hypothetical protein [Vicinamibacterales bacterium]
MLVVGLALWLFAVPQDRPAGAPVSDTVAAAKTLYASGAYEEAIARLGSPDAPDASAEGEQYRALCLLALGRADDARRAVEQLVTRNPFFTLYNADVSPRLVTLLRDVRRRVLPARIRSLYASAKVDFEQRQYPKAATQLNEMIMLLADEDLAADQASFGDLKLLAEGFLLLAEREIAAAARAAEIGVARPAERTDPAPVPVRLYSVEDRDVVAPIEISRTMPAWTLPNNAAQAVEYRGVLRIVIDEQGKVELAALMAPVSPSYDPMLIAAAKEWTFKPAMKNGSPVKYQKLIGVVLKPR